MLKSLGGGILQRYVKSFNLLYQPQVRCRIQSSSLLVLLFFSPTSLCVAVVLLLPPRLERAGGCGSLGLFILVLLPT